MECPPHLAIIHQDHVPVAAFDDFRRQIAADGLNLEIEATPRPGPFAGLEWMLPTAAMLFVAQGYFNGFLGEMGKDHYQALKAGIKALAARFQQVKVTLISTAGKVVAEQPYSLVFSIWFAPDGGRIFKFLVPIEVSDDERDAAIDAFLAFAEAYADGKLPPAQAAEFAKLRSPGGPILVAFNYQTRTVDVMNPITRQFENTPN